MNCSFCKQDERNCECRIRDIAGYEASSSYEGSPVQQALAQLIKEETEGPFLCHTCCDNYAPTKYGFCSACKPDPNESAFDRKEFCCDSCGCTYNWNCIDEDGNCFDCAPEDEGPIWAWLCRVCDTNPVEDKFFPCEECKAKEAKKSERSACTTCGWYYRNDDLTDDGQCFGCLFEGA